MNSSRGALSMLTHDCSKRNTVCTGPSVLCGMPGSLGVGATDSGSWHVDPRMVPYPVSRFRTVNVHGIH